MADDNVHWLRDTYGPALRAFYANLLKLPVPQKIVDLVANFDSMSDAAAPPLQVDGERPAPTRLREPQPDPSD
jgi:hypothetical protein